MKIKTFFPLLLIGLMIVNKSAFAQETTNAVNPKALRNQEIQEIRTERQEAKTTITQIREERKNNISELKQKRLQNTFNKIKMGLEKRHAALLKIKAKLDARIAKNPMNKDITNAVAKLKEFDKAEAKYLQDLAVLETKFNEINTTEIKSSQFIADLKALADIVRKDLTNLKQILVDSIKALAQSPKLEVTKTE